MAAKDKIPAEVVAEARALLGRLTVRELVTREHRRGIFWAGTLCVDGKPVLQVEQHGVGGANRYHPIKGQDRATAEATQQLLEGACSVLGLGDIEPLDTLTAAMEPRMTGLDALPLALAVLGD